MSDDKIKEEIYDEINKYQKDIKEYLDKIKLCSDNYEKIILYKKILDLDNTKEKYVLDYLKCIKNMTESNEYKKTDLEKELKIYQICLSDKNYNGYFKEIPRTNARQKFLDFIKFIIDCSYKTNVQKSNTISKLNFFIFEVQEYKNKKEITWENEELYLNYLYKFLIYSICSPIIHYKKVDINSIILQHEEYKIMMEELEKEIEKEKESDKKGENDNNIVSSKIISENTKMIFLLSQSKFFDYIHVMQKFLKHVDVKFKERFKNLELKNMDDKLLFEDYIYFLGNYNFENYEYVPLWMETFVPLNLNLKKTFVDKFNKNEISIIKFELSQDGSKLKIEEDKKSYVIDIDKYVLSKLINDSIYESIESLKWKLNKYIKPIYYREELFVFKTKEHWKNLLIKIFRSKAYKQIRDSMFIQSQIDFFMIDNIISEIIDNIKFFIYNTSFPDNVNKETDSIYEYGNYDLEIENKSEALLIFYGFHIIINIHQIGGHLNVKYQYYISHKEEFQSPEMKKEIENLYSHSAIERKKESGDEIEIELFGKVKNALKIKEALFILNKDNYELDSHEFKEGFLACNNKTLKELINEDLKEFLSFLGIDPTELDENDTNYTYKYPLNRRVNEPEHYYINKSRHPMSFYYND